MDDQAGACLLSRVRKQRAWNELSPSRPRDGTAVNRTGELRKDIRRASDETAAPVLPVIDLKPVCQSSAVTRMTTAGKR